MSYNPIISLIPILFYFFFYTSSKKRSIDFSILLSHLPVITIFSAHGGFFATFFQFQLFIHIPVKNLFCPLYEFRSGNEDHAAASTALYTHIRPQLHNFPLLRTTGMFFLHLHNVPNLILNEFHPFLLGTSILYLLQGKPSGLHLQESAENGTGDT